MAAELTHLKNVRAGHKGILTKKLRDLEDALKDTPPDRDALEQFKASLEEKLNTKVKVILDYYLINIIIIIINYYYYYY